MSIVVVLIDVAAVARGAFFSQAVGHPRPLARGDQGDLAAVDHGQLALPVGRHQHPHPRAGPLATDLVAEPFQHVHLIIPRK